jgi:predicted DNA-binding transcriptional regulator YafY
MRRVELTGETFAPRGLEGAGRALYTPTPTDVEIRLRLQPAARWVSEYYATTDPVEHEDGTLEVTLPAGELGWVAKLLLRVGPAAQVVQPPEVAAQVRALAERTLDRYRALSHE